MKIKNINLFYCNTPFIHDFTSAHLSRSKTESMLIELIFENGVTGWGESSPRPYVTGETPEMVLQTIRDIYAPILFKQDIDCLQDIERVLGLLEQQWSADATSFYHSALGACDIALLDALGRYNHESVVNILGPVLRNNISYSLSIPLAPISVIEQHIKIINQTKIKNFKILMNSNPDENLERVKFFRSQFGDSVEIRIEANGHWTVQEAILNIERLKPFGILSVEQPVSVNNLEGLREIRKRTGIPVAVDESMCCLKDAEKLIEAEACDILNIKISKCGGLLRSKRIAEFAQSYSIPCQLGSHVGETEVLGRAGECFAQTAPNLIFHEVGSPLLLGSNLKTQNHSDCNKPGLGIQISKQNLKQVDNLHPN